MNNEADKLVTFRLGDDLFAADIFSVERVLRYTTPTAVPDMPDYIEGVIDYQQRVVPIVNLRLRFEMDRVDVKNDTRILILHGGGEWIGVVVDAVTAVTSFDPATVAEPPKIFRGLAGQYLKGIVRMGEKLVILLDVEKLLSSTERIALERANGEVLANG